MEPTPANPPRKRRRWLIVALLLVLVSGVAWWNWPRGDARFVGKWEVHGQTGGQQFLTLKRNGIAEWALPEADFRLLAAWRFDGKYLVIRPIGATLLSPIWKQLNSLLSLRTHFETDGREFEVGRIDESSWTARERADLPVFLVTHKFLRVGAGATLADPVHQLWDIPLMIEAPDWDRVRNEALDRSSKTIRE